jgi:hypothetical protein
MMANFVVHRALSLSLCASLYYRCNVSNINVQVKSVVVVVGGTMNVNLWEKVLL